MARKLPSLNALRAFEAVGRHLSITRAAEELHVTPAAVSHQIKALEDQLGQDLLRRRHRAVLLTDAGQLCLPALTDGFDRLADGVERLAARDRAEVVTVSVTPAFATKWLVPRLERFTGAFPDIDIRISATMKAADLERGEADIAVRYGVGDYPRLRAQRLFEEFLVLVCAPALGRGPNALKQPADLRHHALLHDDSLAFDSESGDWPMWLKAVGLDDIDATRGLRFSGAEFAIQAAVDGAGALLARRSLVADDLAAGRLIEPFSINRPVRMTYHVVCTERALGRVDVAAFRDWMLAEAGVVEAAGA